MLYRRGEIFFGTACRVYHLVLLVVVLLSVHSDESCVEIGLGECTLKLVINDDLYFFFDDFAFLEDLRT